MASDVNVRVTADIGQAQSSLNNLSSEFTRMGDNAEQANEELGRIGSMQRLQALDEMANKMSGVADSVLNFANESVQASAKWVAIDSQFSQVFGDLEQDAQIALDGISRSTGIMSTRMKQSFIQIGAFGKTAGMDTKTSLNLAERSMMAVADSAAFYDRSLEDVTESMQSFLKGNYENDAALGLSATEFTRNAKAMELYGVEFKDLDELQKQFTLLAMVESANELSGALGQASRESDGLENKMGNLEQSIEDFKRTIGDEILPTFIDLLTSMAEWVQRATEWFWELDPIVKQFAGGIALGIVVVGKILPIITGLGLAMMSLNLAMLPVLLIIGAIILAVGLAVVAFNNWDEAVKIFQDVWAVVWAWLQETFPQAIAMITEIVNWFIENWDVISATAVAVWDFIVAGLSSALQTIWDIVQAVFKNIDIMIGTVWQVIKDLTVNVWTIIQGTIEIAMGIIQGVIRTISAIIKGDWEGAWKAIQESTSQVWSGIQKVIGGVFKGISDFIGTTLTGIGQLFSNTWNSVVDIAKSTLGRLWDAVVNVINKIKDIFNFKLKLPEIDIPHIKLPHFSITGSFNPLKGQLPKIGIEWYAKGGIMTNPTAFGMNGNNMMVGGEAGAEAILPLNKRNLGMIGSKIADTMQYNSQQPVINQVSINVEGNVDSDERMQQLASTVNEILYDQYQNQFTWS